MRPLRVAAAAVLGGALTLGGVALWDSPVLDLRTVEVGGNTRVAARDVVVASGLSDADHLLRIATGRVASSVQGSPWVSEAKVERILPSTVRITVVERRPAAVVPVGTASWLVDRDGVVLEQVAAGVTAPSFEGTRLPVVADLPVEAVLPGESVEPPQYRQALTVLHSLPAAVRERVAVVRAPTPDGITLELTNGPVILFGSAEALRDKVFAVRALMEKATDGGLDLAAIDVRVPTRPAARPR
ncbi:MAG: cell division protein FtsQ/DivIB [Actinomycetota bacterium]